ncbi:MAG: ankyrin repeat domain-containing protein [Proteobacteria bacterium]|nr:ankyrin repeat domain-containing protein [Pseudomonadota bacterium]
MHGMFKNLSFLPVALLLLLSAPLIALSQSAPALVEAFKTADLEAARSLIALGADVNETQGDGATALHWAVFQDDHVGTSLLLEHGADVNAANELGATPLWLAAVNGSSAMVAHLLGVGANPNVALKMGETPLMTAARSGDPESVRLLLVAGANPNATEQERGQTALMWAAAQQHADVVAVLVDHGVDLQARSSVWYQLENTAGNTNPTGNFRMAHGGSSALLFAARNGDIETARVLLAAGADVQDRDASGASALLLAAHSGHGQLAEFLLANGADPNAAEAGYTALHAAVLRSQVNLVKALLAKGADLNALIEHGTPGRRFSADYSIRYQLIGTNALWLAAKYGEVEILKTLIEAGADPFFETDRGVTTLQVAMGNSGSSLDHRRDRIGNAAPDLDAEERATLELARTLIDLGVDVNAADDRGQTAMHHAVLKDFSTVVDYLARRGADIHRADKRGQTPLQLAETVQTIPGTNGLRGTRPQVAAVLRRLGASE